MSCGSGTRALCSGTSSSNRLTALVWLLCDLWIQFELAGTIRDGEGPLDLSGSREERLQEDAAGLPLGPHLIEEQSRVREDENARLPS
jgi:hypothetical protein